MDVKGMKAVGAVLVIFALTLGVSAIGQGAEQLIVIGHRVHQATASGEEGKGKDLIKAFEEEHKVDVVYQTYPVPKIDEKFYRLGPLKSCAEDIIHLNQVLHMKDKMVNFLEPLDRYLETKPIDGFPQQWTPSMIEAGMAGKYHYLIPVRAGNWALWYNKEIFDERGIASPPKTAEEFYQIAKKLTFERPTGEKVFGWTCRGVVGHAADMLTIMARIWGGDLITSDFRVTINEPPVIETLKLLRRLYQEGIMPPDWPTFAYAENTRTFMEGRAAMGLFASNYHSTFNDPEKSKIAGNAISTLLPLSRELVTSERDFSIGAAWFWSQGILKGSQKKDLAWEYIRHIASRESHLNMAWSGNPPPRVDVLQHPEYSKMNPGSWIDAKVAPYTRPALPVFPNLTQVVDIVGEHMHNVVVYGKSPQEEMDKAAEKIKPLLP